MKANPHCQRRVEIGRERRVRCHQLRGHCSRRGQGLSAGNRTVGVKTEQRHDAVARELVDTPSGRLDSLAHRPAIAFNGKLDVAPPVIDLTARGFTLVGGRLDYINGEPEGAIVDRRRQHIINLFVDRHLGAEHGAAKIQTVRGFNVRHWTAEGLDFWAVSDINAGELDEFGQKFTAALRPLPGPS
jgi:hypothetical protein